MATSVQPEPDGPFILVRDWTDLEPGEQGELQGTLSTAAVATQRGQHDDAVEALEDAASIPTWLDDVECSLLHPEELVAVLDHAVPHPARSNAALKHYR